MTRIFPLETGLLTARENRTLAAETAKRFRTKTLLPKPKISSATEPRGLPISFPGCPLILNSQDNQGNSNLPKLKYEQRRRRQNHIQAAQAGRTASPAAKPCPARSGALRQGKKHHTKNPFRQPHKKIARGTLQGQNSKIHGKKSKKNDPSQTHSWTESQKSARFLLGEKKQISPRGFFRRFFLGGDRFFLGGKQIFSRGKTDFFSG